LRPETGFASDFPRFDISIGSCWLSRSRSRQERLRSSSAFPCSIRSPVYEFDLQCRSGGASLRMYTSLKFAVQRWREQPPDRRRNALSADSSPPQRRSTSQRSVTLDIARMLPEADNTAARKDVSMRNLHLVCLLCIVVGRLAVAQIIQRPRSTAATPTSISTPMA